MGIPLYFGGNITEFQWKFHWIPVVKLVGIPVGIPLYFGGNTTEF